ncbi:hypothetical protein Tco_1094896 [Tanacetum coccineum]
MEKCLTGKQLSMELSGMMKTFTTSDPLKPNSQLLPLITRYHLKKTLSCEPTVSSLNDEIDFRVSFDDSDDEDYKIQENLIDMINKNELGRGNERMRGIDWNDKDAKRSKEMVDKIDHVMKRREQL